MRNLYLLYITAISVALSTLSSAADLRHAPQAVISNGFVTAKVWLPDPAKGFYRGTRFDWSGVISSLRYQGHEYFGSWKDSVEPHNEIVGPVESFTANNKVLGYKEAKVGETFVRIGVGLCEKPDEEKYQWQRVYKIVDPSKWTIKQDNNWIEFTHNLSDGKGYAYRYTKRLTLTQGKAELVLSHSLTNMGERQIDTEVFNHNFFVIDGRPSGPEFEVSFPFPLTATRADLKGRIAIKDNTIHYPKVMTKGMDGMIGTGLTGFSTKAADNAFQIVNKKTGAGVRAKIDQPLSKLFFWTMENTICPEPFIYMQIKPGATHRWNTEYTFFVQPAAQ
ncbi:hypothetical protein RS130_04535 [Paraglaciecola aquimarina]|uniref:Uncharacterized protein n=1 Tax=Paraglaciecola aquimarina TaxID=1235557 RepID=A0ABU3STG3_9ALTE|nr:hypothetical protein [Paraglaciecola aquimarina]MDU0353295.1 hypothetical protein [Paraglaciecola aquimarina]